MHVLSVSSVVRHMLQVLHLDVSKVDRVLHLPPRLLLPRLGVSSSPSTTLHHSQIMMGDRGGGASRDGNVDVSARSPLLLRAQVALWFTFSITWGSLDGTLPLVGLRLGAASGHATGVGCLGASASVIISV